MSIRSCVFAWILCIFSHQYFPRRCRQITAFAFQGGWRLWKEIVLCAHLGPFLENSGAYAFDSTVERIGWNIHRIWMYHISLNQTLSLYLIVMLYPCRLSMEMFTWNQSVIRKQRCVNWKSVTVYISNTPSCFASTSFHFLYSMYM